MGLFNKASVPVWYMRQAGRYHQHYQERRKKHSFMELCKNPDLACEVTLGPIEDFNFDAAILFSDLLFPLEFMNLGLSYESGPPTLEKHIKEVNDLKRISYDASKISEFFKFQKDALKLLTKNLPKEKTLLGFVGSPFTLYTYAVEGSHSGSLVSAKKGLYDGRFKCISEHLLIILKENMALQAEGGAEVVCIFDTAAGELSLNDYSKFVLPLIRSLTKDFKQKYPDKKILYYTKHTNISYLNKIQDDNIDILGIDWRVDLANALEVLGNYYYIQGNMDPCWLHLEWKDLEANLKSIYQGVVNSKADMKKWIFSLGHGVTVKTPEENVRKSIKFVHENYKI